jgi:Acetyltransferase (GNAT) domain
LIYGYSFYLDQMAGQWDALVLGDYETVMPLPFKQKYGIRYLYQPFLTASLGVFGKNIHTTGIAAFLKAIPPHFKYWDIYLNHSNLSTIPAFPMYERMNYVLPLNRPYGELWFSYSQNIRRNIKKAQQLHCRAAKDIPVEKVIELAKTQLQSRSNAVPADYEHFAALYKYLHQQKQAITYGVYSDSNALLASAVFFFSHRRAYYILVGNHPDGKNMGASPFLIDAFIKDHVGEEVWLDFEGSDIPSLALFYSGFGAGEEKFAGLRMNRLPWLVKWLKPGS